MKIYNTKKAGISLVALVVTIIVLIILTAAVIVTFMEGGIVDRAKEAVFKNDIRTYQEILAVKNAENQIEIATGNGEGDELNATTLAEIQAIIPEFKEEYDGLIAIKDGEIILGGSIEADSNYEKWLIDLGIGNGLPANSIISSLKVGDYVDYNQVGGTYTIAEADRSWIWNEAKGTTEKTYEAGEETIGYQDIMWRVLINDGTNVTLVSAEPVESIYLISGANGFVYGPDKLDEICQAVYGGRNLKIEDVNEILKGDRNWGDDETNWTYIDMDWNNVNVPKGVRTIAQLQEATDLGTSSEVPETGKTFGDYAPNSYSYTKASINNIDEKTLGLVFTNNSYYLSSTCVEFSPPDWATFFCIRRVTINGISFNYMYDSHGCDMDNFGEILGIRPVVTLSSNVLIAGDNTGDGTSSTSPWTLE